MTAAIMLQGTGSDVGKSVLTAGLCRLLTNRGLRVRPFKPQNMSNNAAATLSGGEIGRAQAVQAQACRILPTVDMNPVLLKPQSDKTSQIIVRGKVEGVLDSRSFRNGRVSFLPSIIESFERLRAEADIVIVEGAGSPAEVNLRAGDVANMGFARVANVPVVLIGDIDRGGVIASLAGTKAVLEEADARMIRGFIINRFRGDIAIFDEGYRLIERQTGWEGLGIVPWISAARRLPAEDAIAFDVQSARPTQLTIAVPILPRIANFDDLDALAAEASVCLVLVPPGKPLPSKADVVILPGSKSTIADLHFLREQGWDIDLAGHVRRGKRVFGLCAGYQMLGRSIADLEGIEGRPDSVAGLGYLPVDTVLRDDKKVVPVEGVRVRDGMPFSGYEIHCGQTERDPGTAPLLRFLDGDFDGAVTPDGLVAGCYVHGIFNGARQRQAWLAEWGAASDGVEHLSKIEASLDELADMLAKSIDIERLLAIADQRIA
ncbi:cobyric acid synthase [Hyphomicrobium sp. MC1]|uniref:cobyric acid synthase n=1 Tax=Hyphomicrobium sp. (strain MC1) TaxID=717785 RepID=UPI000213F1ED|nr:cobyric acid synthase [Hyphomicrobium sp. MC1]CCB65510.1 cobyric acid synthase [Hyphomicrobium sp. MC1]